MRRALPFSCATACLALMIAGCGAGEGSGPAGAKTTPSAPSATPAHGATVRAAVAATSRTSARMTQKHRLDGSASQGTIDITGSGDFDFAKDRGSITVTLGGTVTFQEIFADGKVYIRGGATGVEENDWYISDRDRSPARHLLRAPANDPEYTLRQAGMAEDFVRAGEEKLSGAPVVRYRGALPHEALTLRMEKETKDKLEEMRQGLGGRIPVDVDVWVDDRGRAVQTRLAFDVAGVKSVNTVTFTELGKAVKVDVPQGEVVDAPAPPEAFQ